MNKNIKVGVFDWVAFPGKNNFYPEDLPTDWKLSFYANEFETACITLDETLEATLLVDWLDDLPDSFELSFSLKNIDQMDVLTEVVSQTTVKLQYLIVEQLVRNNLLQNNIWKKVLFNAGICRPEQMISESSFCTPDKYVKSGNVAFLPQIESNRLIKDWIELWLSNNGQQDLTLWLDAKTARYSSINELRTLVELMGY